MNDSKYIPGVCNIGEAEIKQRKRVGWIGLGVTIVLWIILILINAPAFVKLILFFPAAMSATGFIQGFMHFCAGFGMKGVFNFGNELYKTDTVTQAEFRAEDRRKAISIFVYSVIVGVIVAVIAFYL